MAGVDLQSYTAQVFARLKSSTALDAAGVAIGPLIRAALGDGAGSIIHAETLKTYTNENPAPRRPLLAFRGGPVAGQSFDMRTALYTWWVYDDADKGYWNINALQKLIERAYPFDCFPFVRMAVSNIGQETTDPAFGWNVRTLQLALITRG